MKIPRQPQTEVHVGKEGYIVIRQERLDGDDQFVLLHPAIAGQVAEAILAQMPEAEATLNAWQSEQGEGDANGQ